MQALARNQAQHGDVSLSMPIKTRLLALRIQRRFCGRPLRWAPSSIALAFSALAASAPADPLSHTSATRTSDHLTDRQKSTTQASRPVTSPCELTQAAALVDEIIENPGLFSQICGSAMVAPNVLSPYMFDRGEERITAANFARLREKRDAVVALLRRRIQSKSSPSTQVSSIEDIIRRPHELAMLIDLNGVEALPELVDYASGLTFGEPEQADALSTITAILRQERYPPLLTSDIEARYHKAISEAAQRSAGATAITVGGEVIPPPQRDFLLPDPIHGTPIHAASYCTLELTCDRYDQIMSWVRDYLRDTPPERWLAAEGMSPWPIDR